MIRFPLFARSAPRPVTRPCTGFTKSRNRRLVFETLEERKVLSGGPGVDESGDNSAADFDALIDLIVAEIGARARNETDDLAECEENVIEEKLDSIFRQTPNVDVEISNLLGQLRRLQDLQVNVDVRLVDVTDSFFDRIGVDFDVNDSDDSAGPTFENPGPSTRVAIDLGLGNQLADILKNLSTGGDEPIRVDVRFVTVGDEFLERIGVDFDFDVLMPGAEQSSEDTTGNGAGSPLGFAILSDIEAFFFVQAAGGDAQHNMFSGPNVTLIDGQAGDDNGQTDPLTEPGGVNSGAGDFDSDSGDSNSGDSDSGDSSSDASRSPVLGELPIVGRMFRRIPRAQVDVDAPTLDAISRDTAVTVPDGGTIVLGGLRSRQRDRQDREGPVLSKLPYVNRLFRNIATGRETSNLMLMVTPRIIIQEEDEE